MVSTIVEPNFVFGLKSDVSDNICYLDEHNVIYPAGSSVVIYNIQQKTQRFIHGTEGSQGFTALAVSPNRRYVAIAEKAERASVTIYDLHSLKKRKVNYNNTPQHNTTQEREKGRYGRRGKRGRRRGRQAQDKVPRPGCGHASSHTFPSPSVSKCSLLLFSRPACLSSLTPPLPLPPCLPSFVSFFAFSFSCRSVSF